MIIKRVALKFTIFECRYMLTYVGTTSRADTFAEPISMLLFKLLTGFRRR